MRTMRRGPIHVMKEVRHTHNGRLTIRWQCTAGDWDQDHNEYDMGQGWHLVSKAKARARFKEHLPASKK